MNTNIPIHLYLTPITSPVTSMVFATSPEPAINLLRTGVVTRLSVSEEWSLACDPENQVAAFYKQALHDGEISLPEWKEEHLIDLLRNDEERIDQWEEDKRRIDEYCIAHYPELSPKWTFHNFSPVPGSNLAFAYAALASLENRPERNPLLLTGPQGSGKSHLLYAIGHRWVRFNTKEGGKLLILTAESLMADKRAAEKIADLTEADCLLIDGLEKLGAPALASFVQLTDELISRGTAMVFTWRSTGAEIDNVATSAFVNHSTLCIVELAGDCFDEEEGRRRRRIVANRRDQQQAFVSAEGKQLGK